MLWIVIIFSVFVIVPLIWLIRSIKIVGPDEMAVKVTFGEPVEFCDSGWVFDLQLPLGKRFKCFLQRYPKKMYNFDYKEREVITKAGREGDVRYGAQKLKVDAVAYLNFPREVDDEFDVERDVDGKVIKVTHPLVKILRAGVPIEEEKLKDWTEEAVVGALRLAFGQITWVKAIKDMERINEIVGENFKDFDGALIKAGFREKGIKLIVAEIRLPRGVEDALVQPDKARLEADAAPYEAEQEAIETGGAVIKTFCNLTGIAQDKVEEALQENTEEFVRKYKDPWEKSWDIIHRRMGIEGGAYLDIRTANSFQDLLALIKRMPMGKPSGQKEEKKEKEEEERKPKPFKKLTEETRQQRKEIEREKKK